MRVAVVGCGTGGPAAALLLAAAGHDVEIFERVDAPSPVGAGLLLQPTGQAVLQRLGLLAEVEQRSARVERLHGETADGRVVMDMAYADLAPGLHGLGVTAASSSARSTARSPGRRSPSTSARRSPESTTAAS